MTSDNSDNARDRVTVGVTSVGPSKDELNLIGVAELVRGYLLRRWPVTYHKAHALARFW
jgi:hypothetical protein